MAKIPFPLLRGPYDLSTWLGLSRERIDELLGTSTQRGLYTSHRLERRGHSNGDPRVVFQPRSWLASAQREIADAVAALIPFQDHVQGYCRGRSIISNAKKHLGKKNVLHVDISRFFESISAARVYTEFLSLGCSESVAQFLTRVCTIEDFLPQGASSSPVLSNLICRQLDSALITLSLSSDCVYTRYSDDIVISGTTLPPLTAVAHVVEAHGFQINSKKCRTQRRGQGQYVTGLSVSDPAQPRVPRRLKRRLRLIAHYAAKYGTKDHVNHCGKKGSAEEEYHHINGTINYVMGVENSVGRKLRTQWNYGWLNAGMIDSSSSGEGSSDDSSES
jgi:retron-type reverse transcriptase